MSAPYYLSTAEGSRCPQCGKIATLLAREQVTGPAFYICFDCRTVAQAGVGPVENFAEPPSAIKCILRAL